MLIPSKFKLGGFTWRVKYMKRLKNAYGDCNVRTQTIRLLDGLSQELTEQTFLHELTHAIQYAMGKVEHNEEYTDAFATLLHQALTTQEYENTMPN